MRRAIGRCVPVPCVVAWVLAASLLLGCGRGEPARRPDVVLVTIDTLRADLVGAYGAGSRATPEIDRLAGSGVVFERAIAAASRTVPSHASMMTSRNTRGHSVGFGNGDTTLQGIPTLAETFREAGYRTAGFVSNILLSRGTGLGAGFETFDDELTTPELNRPHVVERLAADTTDRALAWLDEDDSRPRFLWVHYQDPHGPYTPPPEHLAPFDGPPPPEERALEVGTSNRSRGVIPPYQELPETRHPSAYVSRYAGEIHYADDEIGRLVEHARARAGDRSLVVLITADHGESLGESGFYFMHTHTTTPDVAHVPLILQAEGIAPRRIDGTVGHVDVMPTLLELAGLEAPADAAGIALGPVARGEASLPERYLYCDIGTQLSAYDDEGFVRAGGLAGAWGTPGGIDAAAAGGSGQRYRWGPGGPWRAEGSPRAPLPDVVVDYARRAVAMTKLPPPEDALHEQLRALGYADAPEDVEPEP